VSAPNIDYEFSVSIDASDVCVRKALVDIRRTLGRLGVSEKDCGRIEIVFAEAMNNIVEHAYPSVSGRIDIAVTISAGSVHAVFCDYGCPLPNLTLPHGKLPKTTVKRDSLPEGGFGWFLIHTLTEKLDYTRFEDKNRLSMRIVLDP